MVKNRKTVEAVHGKPHVRIGKSGIHRSLLQEIERRLKEEKVIKVRVLKSYIASSGEDIESIASEVAKLVGAELANVRGHVFVLRKKTEKRRYWK
ncbi:MAG: YhbY family RNA-binding protein [Sulfolobales archaeon]|nr:YhbY family RNA-binding protein [Sulfolobales archaeon]MCX8208057.1 YhbY family RNA-binding protein [Sulfolobales archaeon]MDW8010369.1 YhbY family RNA-binding protein [Sulfolobales archaeon]